MQITDIFKLLGGVGLFLFGMSIMSTGLKNACGDNLQNILECATKNKVVAVFAGLLMTVLVQSSSAIDVMVIGFVNSGMMNLPQAIGVIMGANIGTTITAQITAFNLALYTPLILFAGAVMYLFFKKSIVKHIGSIIMGFGMLFAGITMIKEVVGPLSDSDEFISFISTLNNPALAVAFGVGFTALLQSSSSSIVIFQTFAVQGILTYNTAVYLVIGAAIGSVTPNLLAGLTANREGKRTAVLNLLFNLIRAILLIALINIIPLTDWICRLSPNDVGRQIANTHTIFAVIAVLVELPFTKFIIRLAEKIIPAADVSEQISTAGKEASGTGNMKFMMNGALTVGTLDGANVEMHQVLGDDNMFLFGLRSDEVAHLQHSYDPHLLYDRDPMLRRVVDQLKIGFSDGVSYEDLWQRLVFGADCPPDQYMLLADLPSYAEAEQRMIHAYADQENWNRMSLINIARSGIFAADRSIADYADTIWHVPYKK